MSIRCTSCFSEFSDQESFLDHEEECSDGGIYSDEEPVEGELLKEEDLNTLILECKESLEFDDTAEEDGSEKRDSKAESDTDKGNSVADNTYNCNECGSAFAKASHLIAHLETHNPDKLYGCPECKGHFSYFWSLNVHLASAHSEKRRLSCFECGSNCCAIQAQDCAVVSHSAEQAVCCSVCPTIKSLADIIKKEGSTYPARCEFCKMMVLSSVGRRAHLERCSTLTTMTLEFENILIPERHSCVFCDRKFTCMSEVTEHLRIHTVHKPFSCEVCGKTFAHNRPKLLHVRKNHTGEKPFTCDFCDQKFFTGSDKTIHMRKHTGEKPFVCVICEERFSRSDYLRKHLRRHKEEKLYSCDVCAKTFLRKYEKTRHMRIHTGVYSCHICDMRFMHSSVMLTHLRRHKGEKPYSCGVCHKMFFRKSEITGHMIVHTGEKAYSCRVCERRFSRNCNMLSHLKRHSGEKPYTCEVCGQKFFRKSEKTNHVRVHTGEKPYLCSLCDQRFSRRDRLVQHQRSHPGALEGEKP